MSCTIRREVPSNSARRLRQTRAPNLARARSVCQPPPLGAGTANRTKSSFRPPLVWAGLARRSHATIFAEMPASRSSPISKATRASGP